jgi:hypothetical protein
VSATEAADPAPGTAATPVQDRASDATSGLLPLYIPAAAADLLAVRESWLRRRATAVRCRAPSSANTCGSPRPIWPPSPARAPPRLARHPVPTGARCGVDRPGDNTAGNTSALATSALPGSERS